jgi:hypothetical protein
MTVPHGVLRGGFDTICNDLENIGSHICDIMPKGLASQFETFL